MCLNSVSPCSHVQKHIALFLWQCLNGINSLFSMLREAGNISLTEKFRLLGCDAVYSGISLATFVTNTLLPQR